MNAWTLFVLTLAAQSTLILAIALAASRLLARRGAAMQSAVLRTALVAVLLCPLLALAMGRLEVNALCVELPRVESPSALTTTTEFTSMQLPNEPSETPGAISRPAANAWRWDARYGLAGAWGAVSLLLLVRLLAWHRRLHTLRWQSQPSSAALLARVLRWSREVGVPAPDVRVSPRVHGPLLSGIRRPIILLPEDDASDDVLIHELAHLARRDCAWLLASRVTVALLWWQPLAWRMARKLEETSDEVCDDFVLRHRGQGREYARRLVDLAETFVPARTEALAGLGVFSRQSSLGRRVQRILDGSRALSLSVGRSGRIAVACAAVALALVLACCGFKQPVAAEPDPSVLNFRLVAKRGETPEPGTYDEFIQEDPRGATETLRIMKHVELDGTDVASATAYQNPGSDQWVVSVEFDREGQEKFWKLTRENVNRRIAIMLDGHLESAPIVREPIRRGRAQISAGNMSREEAEALARRILGEPEGLPQADLTRGEADTRLFTAEVRLQGASREYERARKRYEAGVIPLLEVLSAEMQMHYSEVELDKARLELARETGQGVSEAQAALRVSELDFARKNVEVLETVERITAAQVQAGVAPVATLEKVRDALAIARKELEQVEQRLSPVGGARSVM